MTSRFARYLTLVLAAIQFAAPGVASVSEGMFSRRVIDPRAHVEDHAQRDCVPPHSADCAVCRYLVDNVGHTEAPPVPPVVAVARSVAVEQRALVSNAELHGFEARGPPAVAG